MDLQGLIERHLREAYVVAQAVTGSPQDAEDAVSEAVVSILSRPGGYDRSRPFAPYFARTVVHAARGFHRSARRRKAREETAMKPDASEAQPSALERCETVTAVRTALAALPGDDRAAVMLTHVAGFSQSDAGEVLGLPQSTVSRRARRGLDRLRTALTRAGLASLAGAPLAGALHEAGAIQVPASLAAGIPRLAAQAAAGTAGASGGSGAAAAAGGMAMKIVAGAVAAGAFAGAVALSVGSGRGEPAPVNPYNGMQDREEVFEFTQKPKVTKQGDKWVISFASKGKCDATVAIVDAKGKIVRHLASGVLGANAPHPFQQNSLSQKLEWDGEDDTGKKAPAGCKVRVSLGLKPVFERNIAWDPYHFQPNRYPYGKREDKMLSATGSGGETYVLGFERNALGNQGYVFGKDGKYLRSFWPPPAKDVEKLTQLGYRLTETKWGDKTIVSSRYGPCLSRSLGSAAKATDPKAVLAVFTGIKDAKEGQRPSGIQDSKTPDPVAYQIFNAHCPRLVADRYREEIYVGFGNLFRFDGRTGEMDAAWTPRGELRSATEGHVGPDGLLYLRVGGANYGQWVIRMDHDGKIVPFTGNGAAPMPHGKWPFSGKGMYCGDGWSKALSGQNVVALWNGMISTSNVHTRGLYVSPRGFIVCTVNSMDKAWGVKHGVPADWPTHGSYAGEEWPVFRQTLVVVFDKDGNVLTANAAGNMFNGHGVAMDREGNIYSALGSRILPKGMKWLDGLTKSFGSSAWGSPGSLLKFRGMGGKYPIGAHYMKGEGAPAGALAFEPGYGLPEQSVSGALWTWGGLCGQSQDCTCHNLRYDMDYFARHWIPTNYLYSVTVLDANGNRVARLGRYGNVDDTDEDVKAGKDGLRFVWPRAVAVSDTALYVTDTGNRRILKAKLGYHAEEEVPLEGGGASFSTSTRAPSASTLNAPEASGTAGPAPSPVSRTASSEEVCRGWWSLAMSYKRAGRADKAREYLQKILDGYPKSEYAVKAGKELARL